MPIYKTHGTGRFNLKDFAKVGRNVVIEPGVLIFCAKNIEIGNDVYIGHNTILDGYHNGKIIIGNNVWIGSQCFLHGAGMIKIADNVGIGPGVKVLTSAHNLDLDDLGPITKLPLNFAAVEIGDGADIGTNATILPGVKVAGGTQVGAGAVVNRDTEPFSIVAGVPARQIGLRKSAHEKVEKRKISFLTFIVHIVRFIFDVLFLGLFAPLLIYCWLRLIFKKIFKLKPAIIFSPLGAPIPFYNFEAVRLAGYKAQNISFDVNNYFRPIARGLIISDHYFLRFANYLTDYTLLFCYGLINFEIFEFPFSGGLLAKSHLRKLELPLLKILAKKISVYGYGADCKLLSEVRREAQAQGVKYNTAMDRSEKITETNSEKNIAANVERAQKYADVLIAGADLIHLGKKAIMLPLSVDLSKWPYCEPPKNKKLTIIHSTNHRSHKGTRFILEIVEKLNKKIPIELILIEKKTIAECQKIYPKADIFVPDVITGWHGLVAIEAMATGRPVITYLRDDFFKFHSYYAKNTPIISANPDTLARELTKLAKNPNLRIKLGKKGREFAKKYHSLSAGGQMRQIIYQHIWQNKKINQKIFEKALNNCL